MGVTRSHRRTVTAVSAWACVYVPVHACQRARLLLDCFSSREQLSGLLAEYVADIVAGRCTGGVDRPFTFDSLAATPCSKRTPPPLHVRAIVGGGGDDVLIAAVARQWRGKHPLANSARVVTSRNRRLLPDAEDEKGWPDSAYAVSKIAAFAFTLIVGREEYFAKSRVLVNAVCPGYVARSLAHRRLRTRCGGGAVARGGDLRTRWPYLLAAKRQRATLVWCLRQVLLHATDDAHGSGRSWR